jgi:ribosomal silencing factor RsfS
VIERKAISRNPLAEQRAILCAQVAQDHKGKDILVLDLRDLTPIFDFFVIVTGTSRRPPECSSIFASAV